MPIEIAEGEPRVCPGQENAVRFPPVAKEPYDWLRSRMLPDHSLVDVDGFPIDFRNQRVTALFQKREFYPIEGIGDDELLQALRSHINSNSKDWQTRVRLSRVLDIPIFLTVWPRDYPAVNAAMENCVHLYEVTHDLQLNEIRKGNVETLRSFIREYRMGYSPRYVKPLDIAFTKMECYLARNTRDPWPGNLDGVLVHEEEVIALFEFKTHNLESPIQEEDIDRYQRQDTTRFFALGILQTHLARVQTQPVYLLVHWGPGHDAAKIQTISVNRVSAERMVNIGSDPESRSASLAEAVFETLGIS
jgi:hypothetical protein